jgi:4-oxalocrotonate tautomerase family enzyme
MLPPPDPPFGSGETLSGGGVEGEKVENAPHSRLSAWRLREQSGKTKNRSDRRERPDGSSVQWSFRFQRKENLMPVIQCDIREGRTEEEKQAMAEGITRVVHETIGSPVEYVYVLIRETSGSHHIKAGKALPEWTPEERGR